MARIIPNNLHRKFHNKHDCKTPMMIMVCGVFLFVMPLVTESFDFPESIAGFTKWLPDQTTNEKLYCPNHCKDSISPDSCCACSSKLYYDFPQYRVCTKKLDIEYKNRRGKSIVMFGEHTDNNCLYQVNHKHGYLSTTPDNLCSFVNITTIDISYNAISTLGNLSCLQNLDKLILSHNKLRHIPNGTFISLENLRTLDLSENHINYVEPFAFSDPTLSIFKIDMSGNKLKTVDATNVVFTKPFCHVGYNGNQITKIVNDGGFVLDTKTPVFSGGMIDLSNNGLEDVLKLDNLVSELPLLGKLIHFGFDMRGMNLTCDCTISKLTTMVGDVVKTLDREYFAVKCSHPPNLAGKLITDLLVQQDYLDMLICEISDSKRCPKTCKCFEQPSRNRTVVDCRNQQLRHIPRHMPFNENIELLLSNNSITSLPELEYLGSLTKLDLSYNNINEIPEEYVTKFNQLMKLNITGNGNDLKIPRSMMNFNPCQVYFENSTILCNCDSLWLKNWFSESCKSKQDLVCSSEGNIFLSSEISSDMLGCSTKLPISKILGILFLALSIILAASAGVIKHFRYEIVILKRNLLPKKNKIRDVFDYDAFLSFNEENHDIVRYVRTVLLPTLERCNYKLFVPLRDLSPGEFREEETLKFMSRSKSCVIILSECYLNSELPWLRMEYKYAWTIYRSQRDRKMIIVNYDHLKSKEVFNQPFKAMLRLGLDINFSNRKQCVLKQVQIELGSQEKSMFLQNAKPKFQRKV